MYFTLREIWRPRRLAGNRLWKRMNVLVLWWRLCTVTMSIKSSSIWDMKSSITTILPPRGERPWRAAQTRQSSASSWCLLSFGIFIAWFCKHHIQTIPTEVFSVYKTYNANKLGGWVGERVTMTTNNRRACSSSQRWWAHSSFISPCSTWACRTLTSHNAVLHGAVPLGLSILLSCPSSRPTGRHSSSAPNWKQKQIRIWIYLWWEKP